MSRYELTQLIEVKTHVDLMSFTLVTKLGRKILHVSDLKCGDCPRKGYEIACRTLRNMQNGMDQEIAHKYAKLTRKDKSHGLLALHHMSANKQGMDFFEWWVEVESRKARSN